MDPGEAKLQSPAWAPALWTPGVKRGIYGIHSAQILALDCDNTLKVTTDYSDRRSPITQNLLVESPVWPEQIREHLQRLGIKSLIYTTFSCKPDWPKFRVAIPIDRPISSGDYSHAAEYMMEHLELNRWRHGMDIKVIRDPSRLYFTSATWNTPAANWQTEGEPLTLPDPIPHNTLSPIPPPTVTPEASAKLEALNLQRRLANPTLDIPTSTSSDPKKWWQGRFNPSALDLPKLLQMMGFHVSEPIVWTGVNVDLLGKPVVGRRYACECPFAHEHGDYEQNPKSRMSAYIIKFPFKTPIFRCFHSHGEDLLKLLFMEPDRINDEHRP
jgi:hypothetical protein